jgi:hypothetical protein
MKTREKYSDKKNDCFHGTLFSTDTKTLLIRNKTSPKGIKNSKKAIAKTKDARYGPKMKSPLQ